MDFTSIQFYSMRRGGLIKDDIMMMENPRLVDPQDPHLDNPHMNPGNPHMGAGNPHMMAGNPHMNQGSNPHINQMPNSHLNPANPHMDPQNPHLNAVNPHMEPGLRPKPILMVQDADADPHLMHMNPR